MVAILRAFWLCAVTVIEDRVCLPGVCAVIKNYHVGSGLEGGTVTPNAAVRASSVPVSSKAILQKLPLKVCAGSMVNVLFFLHQFPEKNVRLHG